MDPETPCTSSIHSLADRIPSLKRWKSGVPWAAQGGVGGGMTPAVTRMEIARVARS